MSPRRILNFLKRYLLKHPLYVITYVCTYFLKDFSFNEHFFTKEEVIKIIGEGKSIIRFGDGEINLLLDLKNHYESFSPRVKEMMKEIAYSYCKSSNYILSLPRFINMSNEDLKKIGKFNVWLPLKVMFLMVFPKNIGYMDAHNFYYDNYFETVVSPAIKDKKIIYITKRKTIESQIDNPKIPWKDIRYVETPENDALHNYEEVKEYINQEIEGLPKEEVLLLVAMGPAGKFLIFEYAEKGIQGIDIGIAMETMFTGKSLEHLI